MDTGQEYLLIVEDDPDILKLLDATLTFRGYRVITAQNGKDGLEAIRAKHPAIVITDIMMPYLTGLEIVHKVRKEMGLNTPIIIVSSIGLEKTVLEAFQLGADDFITKPFSPNELSVRVKKLLLKSV